MFNAIALLFLSLLAMFVINRGLCALADRIVQARSRVRPLVLAFAKTGELMVIADGVESKAPKTIHVHQWQEVDFVHNSRHAEFKIDRAAANDLFLQYEGTEQRGEDTVEKYEAFNYGTTFYLHVDVETDRGTRQKAIPFEVEADTP